LSLCFDVIILSEIWSNNIEFYYNILPGYTFYYDVPSYTNVGGVGIYVKDKFTVKELHDYKIYSNDKVKVENIWLEVSQSDSKYIIGGIYRHPNSSILDFYSAIDPVLCKISSQNSSCFIAGDINIDLIKCRTITKHLIMFITC